MIRVLGTPYGVLALPAPFFLALGIAPLYVCCLSIVLDVPLSFARFSTEMVLFSVVIYPLYEEVFFRGIIHRELLKVGILQGKFGGLSAANLLTSCVFACVHVVSFANALSALVFFPSLVFGYILERHQKLMYPFLLHAFYNLTSLCGAAFW